MTKPANLRQELNAALSHESASGKNFRMSALLSSVFNMTSAIRALDEKVLANAVTGKRLMAVAMAKVFVTSQESSSLWIGTLKEEEWAFKDEGTIHKFPRENGESLYCNIEGVCEIPAPNGETQIAVVSDKRKKGKKKKHCGTKDESIHIFEIA